MPSSHPKRLSPSAVQRRQLIAKLAVSGTATSGAVIEAYQANLLGKGEVGWEEARGALGDQVAAVQKGDLSMVESMLFSQAQALNTMFCSLARKAAVQEYLPQYQAHMTLALKAQSASRATLEALIEMKQPRQQAVFAKQANIAQQQVNNAYATASAHTSHAEKRQTEPNELLEVQDVDTGTQGAPGGADQELAPVGAVNRP